MFRLRSKGICLFLLLFVPVIVEADSKGEIKPVDCPITEKASELIDISMQLKEYWVKLWLVGSGQDSSFTGEGREAIRDLSDKVMKCQDTFRTNGVLSLMIPHLQEKYVQLFCPLVVAELGSETSPEVKQLSLEYLDYSYERSSYMNILVAIGDPRKKIREAYTLMEQCKEILEKQYQQPKVN